MRILVLKSLLEELLKRTQKLQSTASSDPFISDPFIQTLLRLGFLRMEPDQTNTYVFPRMKWDHQKQIMEAQEDVPLTTNQATQTLTRTLTLLQQEDLIKRFGALRPSQQIQKVMTTDTEKPSAVIPWRITLALTNPHSSEMKGLWHQLSQVTLGPKPGQDAGGTLTNITTPPLRPLLNPAAACYMNSVVTGLVWSAREADGLSEDHWSNFPGVFATIADVYKGMSHFFCGLMGRCYMPSH